MENNLNLAIDKNTSADLKDLFSSSIKKAARLLNKITGNDISFATSFIPLKKPDVQQWVEDILKIKKIIGSLPQRFSLRHENYLQFFDLDLTAISYLNHDQSGWVSPFFRPDCILTADGPKVVEFNIDNGSMAFAAGLVPKDFYRTIPQLGRDLAEHYDTHLDNFFWAEKNFVGFLLNMQKQGKKIHLWDVQGRTETIKKERNALIAFYQSQGLDVTLIEGNVFPTDTHDTHYYFRLFAYVHFARNHALLPVFKNFSQKFIAENDVGAWSLLHDNKLNLSLLWNSHVQSVLTEDEKNVIKRYIPRSFNWHSLEQNERNNILTNKENWIIKYGTSFQGLDVFIGSDLTQQQWQVQLERIEKSGNVIIQEKISPVDLNVEFTNGTEQFKPSGSHIMNFYFVNNLFSGLVFRLNRGDLLKVGAIDSKNVVAALPIFI